MPKRLVVFLSDPNKPPPPPPGLLLETVLLVVLVDLTVVSAPGLTTRLLPKRPTEAWLVPNPPPWLLLPKMLPVVSGLKTATLPLEAPNVLDPEADGLATPALLDDTDTVNLLPAL